MILIDANLLLYAHNPRATEHDASRMWFQSVLSGTELVRFAWLTIWAFLRISTNPRVFEQRCDVVQAETGAQPPQVADTHVERLTGR